MPQRKKDSSRSAAHFHLVDTNIILRFLIGDDPPKATRAASLMERVERSEESIEICAEVLTETVWTLESLYRVPRLVIVQKLTALLNFPSVQAVSKELFLHALSNYAHSNADFVDCFLAARSKLKDVPVYTFDQRDFTKLSVRWEMP